MEPKETAPHDQEADANNAAAKDKPLTVRCNAHSQRTNHEETMCNDNRTRNTAEKKKRLK